MVSGIDMGRTPNSTAGKSEYSLVAPPNVLVISIIIDYTHSSTRLTELGVRPYSEIVHDQYNQLLSYVPV